MEITDILKETLSALLANKVRSGLTVLGIIIGIASVISMLAIGQGAKDSVTSSIQSIGSNLILVMPGAQRGPGTMVSSGRGSSKTLTLADAEAIGKEVSVVKAVAPDVSGQYQVTVKGKNTNTRIIGTVAAYQTVRNVSLTEGNFISDQQVSSGARVAVIGPATRDDLFGENATGIIGQTIRINKINFRVIGLTASKGSSGFNNQDDLIYVPISTAQRLLSGDTKYVSTISATAINADSTTQAQDDVTNLLLKRHKIKNVDSADFNIMNQADIVATASSVTNIFTILLGSVAGISLVVGGIGIMNMMLTTVTERTREIGLRKAIGAKRRDISLQFLIEAIVLTFTGGIIGISLGWLISFSVTSFGLLQAQVTWSSILLAFSVSAIIGIVFGYYPAKRAAELNPIEALRYE